MTKKMSSEILGNETFFDRNFKMFGGLKFFRSLQL